MAGFIISTLAVAFTAWIVYVATHRAAYMQGQHDSDRQWRAELRHIDDPDVKYAVNRLSTGRVPAGTRRYCTCGRLNCPSMVSRVDIQTATGHELDRLARIRRAHVAHDDEIYGRNG